VCLTVLCVSYSAMCVLQCYVCLTVLCVSYSAMCVLQCYVYLFALLLCMLFHCQYVILLSCMFVSCSVWLLFSTGWTTGRSGFDPRREQIIFPVSSVSRPALGPIQPPVQWVPGVISPGVKHGRGVMLTTHPI
jgi:hypothetical protein